MGVRMTEEEIDNFLAAGYTGILATVRKDGSPAMVPLWYVIADGSVFVRTLAASAKAKHVKADPRVSFLVESGVAWAELRAVIMHGTAVAEEGPEVIAAVDAAFDAKYADYKMPEKTPDATRRHYAADRVRLRIVPERKTLTWDNSKLLR